MKSVAAATVLAASMLAAACGAAYGRVYVRTGPPPVRAEVVGVAPGAGYVWVPGYYRYDGGSYVWVGGRWDRPPRRNARWERGHWERDRRGWYYVEGHWR